MGSYQIPSPYFPWMESDQERTTRLLNNLIYGQVDAGLQKTTDAGAPYWTSLNQIPTHIAPPTQNSDQLASVNLGSAGRSIDVMQPSDYTPPVAAHEATHIFQNTRNDDFNRAMDANFSGVPTPSTYDYNLRDLVKTGGKSAGNYNREQQAKMVEDLTSLQNSYTSIPNPTQEQLHTWDVLKGALQRPIQQLIAVPPQDNSLAGRIDHSLRDAGLDGVLGTPAETLKSLFSLASIGKQYLAPQQPPDAPSAALGYINPSKLVRAFPTPQASPSQAVYATSATGQKVKSIDGGKTWVDIATGKPYK